MSGCRSRSVTATTTTTTAMMSPLSVPRVNGAGSSAGKGVVNGVHFGGEANSSMVSNDQIPLTANIIAGIELEKLRYRESLTLFQAPLLTIRLFLTAAIEFIAATLKDVLHHPLFLYFIFPVVSLWAVLKQIDGPHTYLVESSQFWAEFVAWWVGLGIQSSIGLGSGLQSGVLFVFPHIIGTCLAAQSCSTLDFDSYSNMWFRSSETLFQCPPLTESSTPVTYFGTWRKIIIVCFLQAAGTAIGEVPPYWMTRSARLASISAGIDGSCETLDEIECMTPISMPTTPVRSPTRTSSSSSTVQKNNVAKKNKYVKSYERIVKRVKISMVKFLRTQGF
jgi:hypothetical protein